MAATYRTQDSCPVTCPFINNGCYAEGRIFSIADRYGKDEERTLADLFSNVEKGGMVRHHVSGDVGNEKGKVDRPYLQLLKHHAKKRPDIRHIFYTHFWRHLKKQDLPFVINASCETTEDIEQAVAKGFESCITVNENDPLMGQVVAGKKIIRCPQEYVPGVTCASCKLCSKKRKSVVAFVVHGAGRKQASRAINARRNHLR